MIYLEKDNHNLKLDVDSLKKEKSTLLSYIEELSNKERERIQDVMTVSDLLLLVRTRDAECDSRKQIVIREAGCAADLDYEEIG